MFLLKSNHQQVFLYFLFLLINHISRSSNSPESGIGNSHLSLGALGEHFQDIDGDDEFFDPEPLPVLGKCRAIYPFEGMCHHHLSLFHGDALWTHPISAASEGSIPLEEGEDLWLIEKDQGDGWTR